MAQAVQEKLQFNRGLISPLAAARHDLGRHQMAASVQVNWMSRVLGSMMLRPGFQYIGNSASNDKSKGIPFVRSATTQARLEVTENGVRVWIDDAVVTYPLTTGTVTNGLFTTNLTGWTDSDEAGGVSAWVAGGYMSLIGNGTNAAIRDQQVTVNEAGTEHALRVIINRGPVSLRVGTAQGTDEYVEETALGVGMHFLAFTPTGNFWIRVFNRRIPAARVDSITTWTGELLLTMPSVTAPSWTEADLASLRWEQSADVLYVASNGHQQRKIERRGDRSWSMVLYEPENGPFRLINVSPITLAPSALTGDITIAASKDFFREQHVGALFRITSTGQIVTASLTGADQFTGEIRVAGVGGQRAFSVITTGTWVATVTLQYSVGAPGAWVDAENYTTNQSKSYDDGLDNQIIYYRIGIKAGNYTSGTVVATLSHSSGSITGIARISGYTSPQSVSAKVLSAFGGTTGTADWYEGAWSTHRGFPTAVVLHEGRLWWPGRDQFTGSESELYESFDDFVEGDSGPIQRSIGKGPIDSIHWGLSLGRLMIGTATMSANVAAVRIDGNSPISARSSSFDEPLTPTNFNLKYAGTRGVYVDRSAQRIYEIAYNVETQDYDTTDLTLLVPDLNENGLVHIAVQHKPDVRLHCLRNDGSAGVMAFDRAENVVCWQEVETDGIVEDAVILPDSEEDKVYYTVRRTINAATVRFHEKWALESQCTGQPACRHADAFVMYSGAAATTIAGLGHLEGETVVVWGWNTATPFTDALGNVIGKDLGTKVVSGGQITGLSAAVTDACVGLAYTAQWRSTKNAFASATGTPTSRPKIINAIGLMVRNTHCQGLRFGRDFDHLGDIPQSDLPEVSAGVPDTTHIFSEEETQMIHIDGEWKTDSRFCLEAAAPRPCTVLACAVEMTTSG